MLRDMTPYLMGDPCTAFRRPPTVAEMGRDTHELKWSRSKINPVSPRRRRYTKTSIMWTLKPGDTILRMSKGSAVYLYQKLLSHGFGSKMEKNTCGGWYYVERTT